MATLKYFYITYYFIIKKNRLTRQNALLSLNKLKLRQRINQLQLLQNKAPIELKEKINDLFNNIVELKFIEASDYTQLLQLLSELADTSCSHKLSTANKIDTYKKISMSIAPEIELKKEVYQKIFDLDSDLMACFVEIIKLNNEYALLVKDYNNFASSENWIKPITEKTESIEVEHFFILDTLYSDWKLLQELNRANTKDQLNQKSETVEKVSLKSKNKTDDAA